MRYLLDTNILIDWFTRSQGDAQDFLLDVITHEETELALAWVCGAEFLVKATTHEKKSLLDLIEAGDLVLYDLSGKEGLVLASNARKTTLLPLPDSMILATAKTYHATLLTRDKRLYAHGKRFYKEMICFESP